MTNFEYQILALLGHKSEARILKTMNEYLLQRVEVEYYGETYDLAIVGPEESSLVVTHLGCDGRQQVDGGPQRDKLLVYLAKPHRE